MRYFNAQRRPSAVADADLQRLMRTHRAVIQEAQAYQAGDANRHHMGLSVAALGGAATVALYAVAGLGGVSAVLLPVALPLSVAVGLGGLASMVINRIAGHQALLREQDAQADLQALDQEVQRRGGPANLPSRSALGDRLDAAATGAVDPAPTSGPTVRRPGVA